nr:MAG TPA: hypothetical protein [Caudoviricetes sp.]
MLGDHLLLLRMKTNQPVQESNLYLFSILAIYPKAIHSCKPYYLRFNACWKLLGMIQLSPVRDTENFCGVFSLN